MHYIVGCNNGRVELFSSFSGVAYIYKSYLDEYYIGQNYNGLTIYGWGVQLTSDDELFKLNIDPIQNNTNLDYEFSCSYSKSNDEQRDYYYFGEILAEMTENGDLKIWFNIKNAPFDLKTSTELNILFRCHQL